MRLPLTVAALLLAAGAARAAPDMSFSADVLLSPKAVKELRFTGQKIAVSAMYYGDPANGFDSKADEMGQIDLGQERKALIETGGIVVFTGRTRKLENLRYIAGKPKVNVNVFSTLNGQPNNLLDCEIIDGDIPDPHAEITRLHCKLIGEK